MSASLSTSTAVDFLAIARRYAARPDDWPLAPRWDPTRRWYHRLDAKPDHEAWLLTWLPGQGTEWHDHGDSAGAFVVVSGELVERTIEPAHGSASPATRTLAAGTGRWFPRHHTHQVRNDGDRPAVSVHVYSPALTVMTRYEFTGGRLTIVGVDTAGAQW